MRLAWACLTLPLHSRSASVTRGMPASSKTGRRESMIWPSGVCDSRTHHQHFTVGGLGRESVQVPSRNSNNNGGGTLQDLLFEAVGPFSLPQDHLDREILAVPPRTATQVVVTATQAARFLDRLGPSVIVGDSPGTSHRGQAELSFPGIRRDTIRQPWRLAAPCERVAAVSSRSLTTMPVPW